MAEVDKGLAQLSTLTTKDRKRCIETLLKIFRNVVSNPQEPKYRTLKFSNQRFKEEVWRHEGARTLLEASGWVVADDVLHLPSEIDVQATLAALIESRDVKPDEKEWIEETKTVGLNPQRQREEELKSRALKEKEKEMAKLKKEMAERKALAQRIVNEHRHDQAEKRITRPSIAAPRGEGGTAKMSDIKPAQGGG